MWHLTLVRHLYCHCPYNFLLRICLKDIMKELFDNVNKGGFKERFHSKLYRSNVLYLVQSESYVKVYIRQEFYVLLTVHPCIIL